MQGTHRKILAKYDHQVPRYTSYPPATCFSAPDESFSYARWLEDVRGEISLYIHIPFCARLCHYCGCNMRVVNNYDPVEEYLDLLKTEMTMVCCHLPKGIRISHVHFGGGSPTLIKPADFQDLMAFIRRMFFVKPNAEICIEGDPRHMTEAKIAAYAKSGVTRVSLGVQDFNDDVLESVNRPQPFHLTHDAVTLCREYGLDNINFDLMYGLPGQTVENISRTLDLAALFRPSRISYFGYAHVPWMKKHMNLLPQDILPEAALRYELQEVGAEILTEAGYTQIGIDHFVRADDSMALALKNHTLHRNFQGYTTDDAPAVIGLGVSSIGALEEGYHQNTTDARLYKERIKAGEFPTAKILRFTKGDLPVKKIIEELMCYLRVDIEDICRKFSLPPDSFDERIAKMAALRDDGIVIISGREIVVAPAYRVLARVVCECFDHYTMGDHAFQRHARAI